MIGPCLTLAQAVDHLGGRYSRDQIKRHAPAIRIRIGRVRALVRYTPDGLAAFERDREPKADPWRNPPRKQKAAQDHPAPPSFCRNSENAAVANVAASNPEFTRESARSQGMVAAALKAVTHDQT